MRSISLGGGLRLHVVGVERRVKRMLSAETEYIANGILATRKQLWDWTDLGSETISRRRRAVHAREGCQWNRLHDEAQVQP